MRLLALNFDEITSVRLLVLRSHYMVRLLVERSHDVVVLRSHDVVKLQITSDLTPLFYTYPGGVRRDCIALHRN